MGFNRGYRGANGRTVIGYCSEYHANLCEAQLHCIVATHDFVGPNFTRWIHFLHRKWQFTSIIYRQSCLPICKIIF